MQKRHGKQITKYLNNSIGLDHIKQHNDDRFVVIKIEWNINKMRRLQTSSVLKSVTWEVETFVNLDLESHTCGIKL